MMAALIAWLRRVTADLRHILRDAWHGSCTEQHYLELEPPEDDGCCALDDAAGSGHQGPCAYRCSDCGGLGSCLTCAGGCGCDDVVSCAECDGNHHCQFCDEGLVYEDGF